MLQEEGQRGGQPKTIRTEADQEVKENSGALFVTKKVTSRGVDLIETQNTMRNQWVRNGEASIVSYGYDSAEVLVISDQDSSNAWVMDSGCSFYMWPIKSWFEELNESEDDLVLLGNNKECKIKGVGSLSGYIFSLFGTAVSWKATLQSVVALSTTEAEFLAATEASRKRCGSRE